MERLNQALYAIITSFTHRSLFLDDVIVFFGQYLIYFLIAALIGFLVSRSDWRERWFLVFEICLSAILSRGILTEAFQFFYHHPRPFVTYRFLPLIQTSGNSFPSGHAALLFPIAMTLWFYDKRWGTLYFLAGIIMSAARVMSGVHWPFDVIAGLLIGIASAGVIHRLLRPHRPVRPAPIAPI
jgi:undecaprenyl-diphosphatase